ncbi:MAG TPA: class I SAM-dependent methyltransferase [Thermoplasmatales archaeon]|nr:class I SAM-dependent methyltransferase [Thermoplasmatales archaeon]
MKLNAETVKDFSFYMSKYKDLYRDLALSISSLNPNAGSYILDLGAGPGLLVRELRDLLPYANIIALDPSLLMLKSAAKNINRRDYLILSQGEYLPLCDNSVDIVVSRFTLPYWNDVSKVLKEIYRIVKPNGKVIIDALNASYPSWKLRFIKIRMFLKKTPKTVMDYHIDAYRNAYTMEQLNGRLVDNGFRVIETIDRKWFYRIIAGKPKMF